MTTSSTLSFLPIIFSQLLSQLPVIVASIVGLVLLAGRRTGGRNAVTLAMCGFGLSAALALFIPTVYGLLSFAQIEGHIELSALSWVYPVIGILSSLLHAGVLVLFLLACLRFLRTDTLRTD